MNTKIFSRIQKHKFMGLKRVFQSILVSSIILFLLNPALSLEAQERVKSLSVRQFEIEEAIRNGLKYYLDTKDYVLRVKLFGEERSIGSIANEALPGFGQLNDPVGSGAKYWEITRMRVDLVMHKEVSPSVNTYIGEIVPILSGLDYERGDELIFVPILPSVPFPEQVGDPSSAGLPDPMAKALPEDDPKDIEVALQSGEPSEEQDGESLDEEPFWLRMSDIEKILAGMLLFLILLFFLVLWKLRKFKAISTEQEGFPALMPPQSETPQLPSSPNQGFVSIADTNAKLLNDHENHENQLKDAVLIADNERLIQEIIKQMIGRDDWKQELVQEMSRDKQSMDMLTQLIASLGMSTSRKLFSGTIPQNTYLDLEKLAEEASSSPEEENEMLKDIQKFFLTKQLTDPEQNISNPFSFMDQLSTSQIGFLVKDEPAKIKAFIFGRLDSDEAAELLRDLSKDERTKVALELGKLHELPLELVEKIGYNLAEKARHVPDDGTVGVDGIKFIADVLGDLDNTTRQELINGLRTSDIKLSENIESHCFIFESIPVVPKDILLEVVRKLQPDDVITAISGTTSKIKEAAIMCFPEKSRPALVSSLKTKSPDSDEVRAARKLFVQSMRDMSDAGRLNLQEVNTKFTQESSQTESAEQ
jgi:flagellar motor switch protein FliG